MATLASPMLQTRSANIDPYRPPSALRFRDLPTTAHPLDERTLLSPSIGLDISRPSSASSQSSAQHPLSRSFSASALQLPALSALASLAASVPAATTSINRPHHVPDEMNYATSAPAATPGGQQNGPPVCQNCQTSTTPLWRRDEMGSVLCNACGLFLKLHGRARPISLKTDVIKSRNRVKTSGQGGPKKRLSGETASLPAAHPELSAPASASLQQAMFHDQQRRASHTHHHHHHPTDRSPSPLSRTGTPGLSQNHNIAPQHFFDELSITHAFASPSIPAFTLRHPSPSASSINGSHADAAASPDLAALHAQNAHLKTRVSELEVINDLFRGRVAELEQSELEARRAEAGMRELAERDSVTTHELRMRLEVVERELDGLRGESGRKRVRLADDALDVRDGENASARSLPPPQSSLEPAA
ncbi:GATA zinc finger protein 3 [Elasticomyces elasticus]|nr:GATA zinc finger protein 3 [Elasticomyces elasticus]